MCLQMEVLEECTDVMGSVISHTEIQIIGLAASKSVEMPGALGGLFSSFSWQGFQLCLLLLTSFIHLAGLGKF